MSSERADDEENSPPEEEGSEEESSSYDDDDDSFSSSSSSFDSEMEEEGRKLIEALRQENEELRKAAIRAATKGSPAAVQQQQAAAATPPPKTPLENWNEFIQSVEGCSNATIKVTDEMISWVSSTTLEGSVERTDLCTKICQDLCRAASRGFVVIHSILGRNLLELLTPSQQELVYQAIITKHAKTITYWKLGSDDSTKVCGNIPTTALLKIMVNNSSCMMSNNNHDGNGNNVGGWPNLTELEIRGLQIDHQEQIDLLLEFLKLAPKIRQFNLLGMVITNATLLATPGLLDPILSHIQTIPGFDELQLCRNTDADSKTTMPTSSLISTQALKDLFQNKIKWWRFGLDGMGLTDDHIKVIGTALQTSDACKMNDLLSLQNNPCVTTVGGWNYLYNTCMYKQRMGLVLSDDIQWVSTFDLIRPLNNLHRRLEYIHPVNDTDDTDTEMKDNNNLSNNGTSSAPHRNKNKKKMKYKYRSKEAWIEFLSVVGNLAWVGDARQINYLWFAMLEQPELIYE